MKNLLVLFIFISLTIQLNAQIKLDPTQTIKGLSSSSIGSITWVIEPVDSTYFRLRKPGTASDYIHCESGSLEFGAVPIGFWSAQWQLEQIPGTSNYRIKNRFRPAIYVNAAGALQNTPTHERIIQAHWSKLPTPRLKVLYVLPQGQVAKPRAVEALNAILAIVQTHFLEELGVTFELESDLVSTVKTSKSVTEAVDWNGNRAFIESQVQAGYLDKGNVVYTVLQGTSGAAGGSFNIVKMTGGFWDEAYNAYINEPHLLATKLYGWSHELGHAFGLLHSEDAKAKFKSHSYDLGNIPSCIMQRKDNLGAVYNYPFLKEEKSLMLDINFYNKYKDCAPFINGRPFPTKHLVRKSIQPYRGSVNGRTATMIEFWNRGGAHGSVKKDPDGKWRERNSEGKVAYTFRESARDDWSVILTDDSRRIEIQLDLHSKRVNYWAIGSNNKSHIYDIVWAR